MAEWLVEAGVGETRAALVDGGDIVEALVELEGVIPAGSSIRARLIAIGQGGRNAVARGDDGQEFLLPAGAAGVSEGRDLMIEVTRSAFPGREPWKRSLARVTTTAPRMAADLTGRLGARDIMRGSGDELGEAGWNELIEEARHGTVGFPGGTLRISPTPAMTLIDVDGNLPPEELALCGAAAAAKAIRRLAIAGSIGIDLPTVRSKAARVAQDAVIDALVPRPFERTAVNGFGFVQIVRPRRGPSLVELAQDPASFEARALIRMASRSVGSLALVAHPSVLLAISPGWADQLSRIVGGAVRLRGDPTLGMAAGYVER